MNFMVGDKVMTRGKDIMYVVDIDDVFTYSVGLCYEQDGNIEVRVTSSGEYLCDGVGEHIKDIIKNLSELERSEKKKDKEVTSFTYDGETYIRMVCDSLTGSHVCDRKCDFVSKCGTSNRNSVVMGTSEGCPLDAHKGEYWMMLDTPPVIPTDLSSVKMEKDVQNSSHYQGDIETIDFMKDKMTEEEFRGYLLGNILKYASRLGKKDTVEKDAYKILDYACYLSQGVWFHESKDEEVANV